MGCLCSCTTRTVATVRYVYIDIIGLQPLLLQCTCLYIAYVPMAPVGVRPEYQRQICARFKLYSSVDSPYHYNGSSYQKGGWVRHYHVQYLRIRDKTTRSFTTVNLREKSDSAFVLS